jgi:DNA segregation ATPase FtsK/SpoIIIE, S-DNA-T family
VVAEPATGRSGQDATDIEPSDTRVFEVPRPPVPRAVLQVTDPDGQSRRIVVEGGNLTIGRATDNDLVTRDSRVSRHHGRITGRRGTLVYVDLGSTNGSRVNGVPVTEVVLGAGDRLGMGDIALVVEVAGAPI